MSKVFRWSLIVSLAGLLFGFDTVVISGADKQLQLLWNSSDFFHGFVVMAMALWGTVVGAATGGFPARKYGRKNSLIGIGILYLVSAIGSALVNDPFSFALFRFIGGLGVGASTIAAPAYISEISPSQKRGQLVAMYQFSIVLGILLAMLSNYALKDLGENSWRWMLGIEAIPAFVYCLFIFRVPKSPRWLVFKNRISEAKSIIEKYKLTINIDEIIEKVNEKKTNLNSSIFKIHYRRSLLLVFFIAAFNQLSGINAFLYYAPRIFEEAGLERGSSLLGGVWIGLVNLIFTLVGMALIDRYGRKKLMYLGSFGYIISLASVAIAFQQGWSGQYVITFLLLFIASHAIGQGTVIWVFIAEIFPTHLRASGQAFGSTIHWVLAAIIPSTIPSLFTLIGPSFVFYFFALCMLMQLIWVYKSMPETSGASLEELSDRLNAKAINQ